MVAPATRRGKVKRAATRERPDESVPDEGHPNEATQLLGVGLAIEAAIAVASAQNPDVGHRAQDEAPQREQDDRGISRQERHGGKGGALRSIPEWDEGTDGPGLSGLVSDRRRCGRD